MHTHIFTPETQFAVTTEGFKKTEKEPRFCRKKCTLLALVELVKGVSRMARNEPSHQERSTRVFVGMQLAGTVWRGLISEGVGVEEESALKTPELMRTERQMCGTSSRMRRSFKASLAWVRASQ